MCVYIYIYMYTIIIICIYSICCCMLPYITEYFNHKSVETLATRVCQVRNLLKKSCSTSWSRCWKIRPLMGKHSGKPVTRRMSHIPSRSTASPQTLDHLEQASVELPAQDGSQESCGCPALPIYPIFGTHYTGFSHSTWWFSIAMWNY